MTRGRSVLAMAAAVVAVVMVTGCGLPFAGRSGAASRASTVSSAAGTGTAASQVRATVARAQHTHEIPTPAPAEKVLGGWRSPVQAVQVYAEWYINWTAATVAMHLRTLAGLGMGQARSTMTLAAAQVGKDSALKLGGIANSGTVEAIAPVTGEPDVYAVVTRERTTATNTSAYQGLRPAWHVTLATVTEVFGHLWTISGWQPEN